MKANQKTSPFDGIKIGYLELDSTCCPQLFCEGRELGLNWKTNGENHFSAELDFGILNLEIIPSAAVAERALPSCTLVFVAGQDMQDQAAPLYQVLFDANPASVGGQVPDDGSYFK